MFVPFYISGPKTLSGFDALQLILLGGYFFGAIQALITSAVFCVIGSWKDALPFWVGPICGLICFGGFTAYQFWPRPYALGMNWNEALFMLPLILAAHLLASVGTWTICRQFWKPTFR
jgi:hypothetical protein